MKTWVLIDGNNLTLRFSHALSDSKNPGVTSIVPGVFRSLFKIVNFLRPDAVIWCWDQGRSKRRLNIYPDYKKRTDPNSDLMNLLAGWSLQCEDISEGLNLLGVPQIKIPDFEADDIISNIVYEVPASFTLVSGDQDFYQFLSEDFRIFDVKEDTFIDELYLEKKFGLQPHEWVHYKALVGDRSDNITGVTGVGQVRALEVIKSGGVKAFLLQNNKKKWVENLKDQVNIYERNLLLMDLKLRPAEEVQLVLEALISGLDNREFNPAKFQSFCEIQGMNLLADYHYWDINKNLIL